MTARARVTVTALQLTLRGELSKMVDLDAPMAAPR
jgi:hypothetical protein